jgi:hypothetical protein
MKTKYIFTLAFLLVMGLTVNAQSNHSISLTIEKGQSSTFSVNEFVETIHVTAGGMEFWGSLTLQAPEGCLMEVSGYLNGHPGSLTLNCGCSGVSYEHEFQVDDGNVYFGGEQPLITHGNCLTFTVSGPAVSLDAVVHVYHPDEVSSEENLRMFLEYSEQPHLKLIDNIALSEMFGVDDGKSIEIDLNGHTVSRNLEQIVEDGHVFTVAAGATLTIKDSSMDQLGTVTGGKATQGGAIYNAGTFIIESGRLSGNKAVKGGGIYNGVGARCVIRGQGVIRSNEATDHGGGVWSQGVLEMEDEIQVKNNVGDNVYLTDGHTINVTGAITSGENSIGIEMEKRGQVTSGYSASGTVVNPFFACASSVNKVVAANGECWWCYGYIECIWDSLLNVVTYTERTIPVDKEVDNICSSKYASGGGLWGESIWFVAEGTGSTANGLTCHGDVHLILCDSASITIANGLYLNAGSTLHIYSQSFDGKMGKLISENGESNQPGIGPKHDDSYMGVLHIHGGDIKAKGGKNAAGIGGCEDRSSGEIRIWGGKIQATGGESGAGIGGGYGGSGTLTNIYGGDITAQGGGSAAGIGGGEKFGGGGDSGKINIYGGVVNANGGMSDSFGSRCCGAGIGGGGDGPQTGPICIYGGKVKATGCNYSAGIGGGGFSSVGTGYPSGGTIKIYGGEIEAYGGQLGAGVGGGMNGSGGHIEIYGGRLIAVGRHDSENFGGSCSGGAGIGGGGFGTGGDIHIFGGEVYALGEDGAGIGGGRKKSSGSITIDGGNVVAIAFVGGAGIGSGSGYGHDSDIGQCDNVVINGGKVLAFGGNLDCMEVNPASGSKYNAWTTFLKILSQMCKKAPYFQFAKDMIIDAVVQLIEALRPEDETFGGAGIGGGLKCNCSSVQINGGIVVAFGGDDDVPAIGHGLDGNSSGTLSLFEKAMVIAGATEDDATMQLCANRGSACQNNAYVRIDACGHRDSEGYVDNGNGTYTTGGSCLYCGWTGPDTLNHTFFEEGAWSNRFCWKSGHVPNAGNSVVINENCDINDNYEAVSDFITCTYGDTIFLYGGGELIHHNQGVLAVVEKKIIGYNDNGGGWNFIASPVTETFTATVANGLLSGNYDLYYYDEPEHYWRNHKQGNFNVDPGFKLNNGQGYLYANAATDTLEFTGTLRPGEDVLTVSNLSHQATTLNGFNLIGNPFAFSVFANQPYYTVGGSSLRLVENYWENVIPPCEGIMVKATAENNYSVTLSRTEPEHTNNGRLQIIVTQQVIDRKAVTISDKAIVSFNPSNQLEKFSFGDNAQLYIPEGACKYAIAVSECFGEMPVNFKPSENGSYMLTVNPADVEMDYLHLIDNMTGADVDLLQTPSYSFVASTSDYESRFRLVFDAKKENGTTDTGSFAYYADGEIRLVEPQYIDSHSQLQIIDMMGRIVKHGDAVYRVPTDGLAAGLYVLRLVNAKETRSQKIRIN